MGEAFRIGLGFPETAEWRAQGDLARTASTLVDSSPKGADGGAGAVEAREKKLATLREFVVKGYKTQRMSSV